MGGIVDIITGLLGTILYPLFSIIFLLIDGVQDVFYSFAGIGDASYDGTPIYSGVTGEKDQQGLVYYILQEPIVKNTLISMLILGLFLIVIFTTFAFIKNMYSAKPKGWKEIISNSIKGLFNFILLPVCTLLGVWLGNVLLRAINGATSTGGSTTMARKLFVASAYNANIYRNMGEETDDAPDEVYIKVKKFADQWGLSDDLEIVDGQTLGYYADIVDKMYSYDRVFLGSHIEVGHFYNLFQINYIILVVGGIFMLYVLGSLAFAMVKRLFYIVVLFVISPGVCALYPIDEGSAVKSWSGEVKKQVLSAYGAVAGLNIFFSLVPMVDKISIFKGGSFWTSGFGINDIIQIFILVTGLLVVKDLIGLISGFAGGDNAYSTGSGLMKGTQGAMKKYVGGAVKSTTGAFASAKAKADAQGTGAKGFLKNLGEDALKGGFNKVADAMWGVNFKDTKKHYKDTYKGAEEKAWEGYDPRDKAKKKENDEEIKKLLKDFAGKKIDAYEIAKALKSVKGDEAKQKYELQLLAHNNRINADNHADLDKKGSYIEKAKKLKEFEDGESKRAEKARVAFEKVQDAEKENGGFIGDIMSDIHGGTFNIVGDSIFGSVDKLSAMLQDRQKIDVSKLETDEQIEKASQFNQMLQNVIDSEKRLERAQESYASILSQTEESVRDFAKSFKIELDTTEVNTAMLNLKSSVEATRDTTTHYGVTLEELKNKFKSLGENIKELDKIKGPQNKP